MLGFLCPTTAGSSNMRRQLERIILKMQIPFHSEVPSIHIGSFEPRPYPHDWGTVGRLCRWCEAIRAALSLRSSLPREGRLRPKKEPTPLVQVGKEVIGGRPRMSIPFKGPIEFHKKQEQ